MIGVKANIILWRDYGIVEDEQGVEVSLFCSVTPVMKEEGSFTYPPNVPVSTGAFASAVA